MANTALAEGINIAISNPYPKVGGHSLIAKLNGEDVAHVWVSETDDKTMVLWTRDGTPLTDMAEVFRLIADAVEGVGA